MPMWTAGSSVTDLISFEQLGPCQVNCGNPNHSCSHKTSDRGDAFCCHSSDGQISFCAVTQDLNKHVSRYVMYQSIKPPTWKPFSVFGRHNSLNMGSIVDRSLTFQEIWLEQAHLLIWSVWVRLFKGSFTHSKISLKTFCFSFVK